MAKREHFNNLIKCSKNKTKTMWNIVKAETNTRVSKDKLPVTIEGKSIKNYHDLANLFNEYFINATNTHQTNNMSTNSQAISKLYSVFNKPFPQLNLTLINAKEVKDIIRTLKWKSSYGYEEIPLKILKISAPYIISLLIYLCNKSMITGIFPMRLKYSQIFPVYKKGDKHEPKDYRPISLLTSFSKIFEKVIFNRLYNHVMGYKILAKEQYGFRNNYSTDKAIYHLTNNILKALDNNQLVGGIFCDLSKASDYVNYDIFFGKIGVLWCHGPCTQVANLIPEK